MRLQSRQTLGLAWFVLQRRIEKRRSCSFGVDWQAVRLIDLRQVEMDLQDDRGVSAILEPTLPQEAQCFTSEGFGFFLARELAGAVRYAHFAAFSLFRVSGQEEEDKLEKLVRCLSRNIRQTDYLGRLTSDTVGVILQHATVENAAQVLERLKRELRDVFGGEEVPAVHGSVAVFPTEANTREGLTGLAWSRLQEDSEGSVQGC
jgi:hypothetical protein